MSLLQQELEKFKFWWDEVENSVLYKKIVTVLRYGSISILSRWNTEFKIFLNGSLTITQ